jgi:hypothetical protein
MKKRAEGLFRTYFHFLCSLKQVVTWDRVKSLRLGLRLKTHQLVRTRYSASLSNTGVEIQKSPVFTDRAEAGVAMTERDNDGKWNV